MEFEQHEDPLVFPAFGPGELEYLWRMGDELHQAGSRQRVERLSADELRALEPALSGAVIGGVIAHGERRVRPERLTRGRTPGGRRPGRRGARGHAGDGNHPGRP